MRRFATKERSLWTSAGEWKFFGSVNCQILDLEMTSLQTMLTPKFRATRFAYQYIFQTEFKHQVHNCQIKIFWSCRSYCAETKLKNLFGKKRHPTNQSVACHSILSIKHNSWLQFTVLDVDIIRAAIVCSWARMN